VGALAAIVHSSPDERWGDWITSWARRLAWPAATALLLCVAFGGQTRTWLLRGGFTAVALASICVIVHGATGESSRLNRFLENRSLVWAGRRSYGIYVFHLPIIAAFEPLRHHGVVNFLGVTAARASVTLVVAWASYGLVESRILVSRRA
jgi:peptidoglycan/LPS O-acetylase OafA/YrhL